LETFSVGELKMFHADACPAGWAEVESLKGYLLMGRPKDGTTGTVVNSPLSKNDAFRVGPHTHGVKVTDNGHGHGITDRGHGHSFGYGGGHSGGNDGPRDGFNGNDMTYHSPTSSATTGIAVNSAKSGVGVTVDTTGSEGYPFAYVLLCQRISPSRASSTSFPVVGCPGGSLSACVPLCPSNAAAFTVCVGTCSTRCSS